MLNLWHLEGIEDAVHQCFSSNEVYNGGIQYACIIHIIMIFFTKQKDFSNWTLFKSKTLGSICLTVFKISLTEFKTLVLISAAYRITLIRFWHLFCILAHQAWQTWFIFNTIRLNRVNDLFVPRTLWIIFRKWRSFSVSLSTDLSQSVAGIEFLFSNILQQSAQKGLFNKLVLLGALFQYPCRCLCH